MKASNQNIIDTARTNKIISGFFTAVIILFLTHLTITKTPGNYEITKDAKENVISSYNLYSKGIISIDGKTKSNFREPLTIAVLASHIALFTDIPDNISNIDDITKTPHYIKQINYVNLYYIIVALLLMWRLGWQLTKSNFFAATFIFTAWFVYFIQPWYLARPLPEYASSMFILAIATLAIDVLESNVIKKTILFCFLLGVCVGLLSLTKAATFYVSLVFIPIFIFHLHLVKQHSLKISLIAMTVTLAGMLLMTSPWILRNQQLQYVASNGEVTKAPMIASRGGAVLLGRSHINQQISSDPIGAVYAFSPPAIQRVFEEYLGYKNADLWEGGKYESFNRNIVFKKNPKDTAINAVKIQNDSVDLENAKRKVINNFSSHLTSTFVLAWRGIWSFDGGNHLRPGGKTSISLVFNLFCFVSLLVLPIWALITKNHPVFLATILPLGVFWIYALISHFIPHYSAQLIPMAVLSGLLVLRALYLKILFKFKP